VMFLFFFSSRRRHTRSDRDWSSDVCSSDLSQRGGLPKRVRNSSSAEPASKSSAAVELMGSWPLRGPPLVVGARRGFAEGAGGERSEERRVGKEGRSGGAGGSEEKEGQGGG